MAYAGARVSTMAKRRLSVTTSPEFATSLHTPDAREEDAGCVATLADRYTPLWPDGGHSRGVGNAQSHHRAQAQRPRLSDRAETYSGLAMVEIHDSDEPPVSGIDTPAARIGR